MRRVRYGQTRSKSGKCGAGVGVAKRNLIQRKGEGASGCFPSPLQESRASGLAASHWPGSGGLSLARLLPGEERSFLLPGGGRGGK